jgi:hypothetical protein
VYSRVARQLPLALTSRYLRVTRCPGRSASCFRVRRLVQVGGSLCMYVRLSVEKRSAAPIAFLVVLLQTTTMVVQIHFPIRPAASISLSGDARGRYLRQEDFFGRLLTGQMTHDTWHTSTRPTYRRQKDGKIIRGRHKPKMLSCFSNHGTWRGTLTRSHPDCQPSCGRTPPSMENPMSP